MGMTFGVARNALIGTLGEIPDYNTYAEVQDSFPVPAIFVTPANPVCDRRDRRAAKRQAVWRMLVTVLVNRIEINSAQAEVDALTDLDGVIFGTLEDPVKTRLGGVAQYTEVTRIERYGSFRVGNTDYYGCQFLTEVIA